MTSHEVDAGRDVPPPAVNAPVRDASTRGSGRGFTISDEDAFTKHPGRIMISILELRRHLFRYLDDTSLARTMRTEKSMVPDAAAVLYANVGVLALSSIQRAGPHRSVYSDAVKQVTVDHFGHGCGLAVDIARRQLGWSDSSLNLPAERRTDLLLAIVRDISSNYRQARSVVMAGVDDEHTVQSDADGLITAIHGIQPFSLTINELLDSSGQRSVCITKFTPSPRHLQPFYKLTDPARPVSLLSVNVSSTAVHEPTDGAIGLYGQIERIRVDSVARLTVRDAVALVSAMSVAGADLSKLQSANFHCAIEDPCDVFALIRQLGSTCMRQIHLSLEGDATQPSALVLPEMISALQDNNPNLKVLVCKFACDLDLGSAAGDLPIFSGMQLDVLYLECHQGMRTTATSDHAMACLFRLAAVVGPSAQVSLAWRQYERKTPLWYNTDLDKVVQHLRQLLPQLESGFEIPADFAQYGVFELRDAHYLQVDANGKLVNVWTRLCSDAVAHLETSRMDPEGSLRRQIHGMDACPKDRAEVVKVSASLVQQLREILGGLADLTPRYSPVYVSAVGRHRLPLVDLYHYLSDCEW